MTKRTAPLLTASILGLALAGAVSHAHAEGLVVPKKQKGGGAEDVIAAPPSNDWMDYTTRPLTLNVGTLGIHGDLVADVSTRQWGKPVWITPNVYYGVTDQLSVGIAENPRAEFWPTGGGLCLSTSVYCGKVFNNLSLDLLFSFTRSSSAEVVLHAGLDILSFSPFIPGVRGGLLMKLILTREIAVMADPAVVVRLKERGAWGESILVPVRVGYQVQPQVNLGLITGLIGVIPNFGDGYQIPLGINAIGSPSEKLDVALNLTFANVAGRGASIDYRSVALTVNYRM